MKVLPYVVPAGDPVGPREDLKMRQFTKKWDGLGHWLTLLFIVSLAGYFYFANRSGAMPGQSDESRAYHFTLYSPMIYIVSSFFMQLLRAFDAPYYAIAFVGTLNVLMIYALTRRMFSAAAAVFAAIFYACYGFPLGQSLALCYPTYVIFFCLMAFYGVVAALESGRMGPLCLAGAAMSLMFFFNASAYAPILALTAVGAYSANRKIFGARIGVLPFLSALALGAIITYLACEFYIYRVFGTRPIAGFVYSPYWKHLFWYHASPDTGTVELMGAAATTGLIRTIFKRAFFESPEALFRNGFIVVLMSIAMVAMFKRADRRLRIVVGFGMICLVLLFAGGLFRIHVIHRKPIAPVAISIAMAAGYSIQYLLERFKRPARKLFWLTLAIYLGLSGFQCQRIVGSMVSREPILRYLKEHRIPTSQVLTLVPFINTYQEQVKGIGPMILPIIFNPRASDHLKGIYNLIDWPRVFGVYGKGQSRYYVTSGIGTQVNIGNNDAILADVQPVKIWDFNPANNRYLYEVQKHHDIRLYALSDIFDRKDNMKRLMSMGANGVFPYTKDKA
ncbi:MAG: hypothetical protein WCG06_02575 [Candidatus Omnitrophota bacterium]